MAHPRRRMAFLICCVALATSCGSADDHVSTEELDEQAGATTVTIADREYTCGELIAQGQDCLDEYQTAFDRWGTGIDDYVNSGRLGPLGNDEAVPFDYVAAYGLAACIQADRGDPPDLFVEFVREDYPEADATVPLPMWDAALELLCTDVDAEPTVGGDPTGSWDDVSGGSPTLESDPADRVWGGSEITP